MEALSWKYRKRWNEYFSDFSRYGAIFYTIYISFIFLNTFCTSQLVVNVKNKGGDLIQESIQADTKDNLITLEFQKLDGTLLKMLIDFKSEVQIFKVIVLGEEERGETQYQTVCFVTRFAKNEFISSDAMSKLRQKNPGTIRNPEEDKGKEHITLDLGIHLEKSSRISPYIYNICSEAKSSIYSREQDVRAWSKGNKLLALYPNLALSTKGSNMTYNTLISATQKLQGTIKTPRCNTSKDWWKPCQCRFEMCIGWYPCGLKYCRGRDSAGKVVSYRCGIKTCKKCRSFDYYVGQRSYCMWDEM
ncbi:out at first protein homolog [Amphiura filiformis]|uniref:out at first protein homolog n=1 Tax=Amphiura filiformis TaxID=82378 RepID=UPI003B21798D